MLSVMLREPQSGRLIRGALALLVGATCLWRIFSGTGGRKKKKCLVFKRAHTEGTYHLPAGHYPRGALHVPIARQGADTPTHPVGTGMGRR